MSMIHIRRSLVASAMLATVAPFAPAHAGNTSFQPAGVQILDPSGVCASWTLGGTAALPTLTCIAAAPPVAGSPVCTITANSLNPPPPLPATGGSVTLSATCTNTDALTTWAWTASPTAPPLFNLTTGPGVSAQVQAGLTVGATTTFGVIATNATGPSANKTVKVTVGTPPPPPPPPTGINCSAQGFKNTIEMKLLWPAKGSVSKDTQLTGFSDGDIVVAWFTTPATSLSYGALLTVTEIPGAQSGGHPLSLSTVACDFAAPLITSGSQYIQAPAFGHPETVLRPNTTYYFNVKNSCLPLGADCPIMVTLKPQ